MINQELQASGGYYGLFRHELLPFFEKFEGTVLDVGCGSGELLKHLKSHGAKRTIGLEMRPDVAEGLRSTGTVDEVLTLDVEATDLPIAPESLDAIIVSHVLEHMANPWNVLRRLRKLIKPDGMLVGAIPNARHISVSGSLLFGGTWHYRESGILDVTHLRFFTRRSMVDLLETSGFSVREMTPEIAGPRATFLSKASFRALDEVVAYAYNFRCVKSPAAKAGSLI